MDVDPAAWHSVTLRVENTDTTALRDLDLFLRYDARFAEDTLTVRIATLSPDSLRCEESLFVAVPRERVLFAPGRECVVPYRRRCRLDRPGLYRFTVAPCRPVRGVEAVGMSIAASKQ